MRKLDCGLPADAFSNPAKKAKILGCVMRWCTEARSDFKKTVRIFVSLPTELNLYAYKQLKDYTFHESDEEPADISLLETALLAKTNPRLKVSFELRTRLALMVSSSHIIISQ